MSVTCDEFVDFFQSIWQHEPFPWQKDLAVRLCHGEWPRYITAPTGSGKTACLDAAIFALAAQSTLPPEARTAGRRIFFIVNRRVIVDEAYERAGKLCQKLAEAKPGSISRRVADALRSLNCDPKAPPLTRSQLRGGIYRERSWVSSLLQPMIVCSTVDQAGSRLLFRGYGVTDQARPIHAALVAQDSILIIDEAHISRPFVETVEWIEHYRRYESSSGRAICLPFQMIQMTATPPRDAAPAERVALTTADREHAILGRRLAGKKTARLLVEPKAKGKGREDHLCASLADEAKRIVSREKPRSIAIMVNRVSTARNVHRLLNGLPGSNVSLLIGRLRPIDRDELTAHIQGRLKTDAAHEPDAPTEIVVSTQCLEVGADLDFDALVTEAASLDALRQRFGRLNRGGRPIAPTGAVIMPADQEAASDQLDDERPIDPIYGNAIPRTWNWLRSIAQEDHVDFGIDAMSDHVRNLLENAGAEALTGLLSPSKHAPVLLPAYLDCWVQTNPTPAADPDVAIFLHGPDREMSDVQVCWRADLSETVEPADWAETLSLCPPTTAECLPVPLHHFRTWMFADGEFKDNSADTEQASTPIEKASLHKTARHPALIWKGTDNSQALRGVDDLFPGATIVLRTQTGGWSSLGILPSNASDDPETPSESPPTSASLRDIDVAEISTASVARKAILRVHPSIWPSACEDSACAKLLALAGNPEADRNTEDIRILLQKILTEGGFGDSRLVPILQHLASATDAPKLVLDEYPDGTGFAVSTSSLLPDNGQQPFEVTEIEAEALLEASSPQSLAEHTAEVSQLLDDHLRLLPVGAEAEALRVAARLHDCGKADPRFQALLRSSSVFAAIASGVVLAKSGSVSSSYTGQERARLRAGLPRGFRHEMLSVQMAAAPQAHNQLPNDDRMRSLALHLISSHHGYGRPFAPVVEDPNPPSASMTALGISVTLTPEARASHPPHHLGSGIVDRFWEQTRYHGWWGLALLESVLRLADQIASASRR